MDAYICIYHTEKNQAFYDIDWFIEKLFFYKTISSNQKNTSFENPRKIPENSTLNTTQRKYSIFDVFQKYSMYSKSI